VAPADNVKAMHTTTRWVVLGRTGALLDHLPKGSSRRAGAFLSSC